MTKKIFRSILAVAGTVLLASLLVIMGCLYEYFGSVEKKQLHDELALAAAAVEENGTGYLEKLSSGHYRLTWIAPDGAVIFDTETDAESLENHADREEVKRAFEYARAIPPRCCKKRCTARKSSQMGVCCAFPSAARRQAYCLSA